MRVPRILPREGFENISLECSVSLLVDSGDVYNPRPGHMAKIRPALSEDSGAGVYVRETSTDHEGVGEIDVHVKLRRARDGQEKVLDRGVR